MLLILENNLVQFQTIKSLKHTKKKTKNWHLNHPSGMLPQNYPQVLITFYPGAWISDFYKCAKGQNSELEIEKHFKVQVCSQSSQNHDSVVFWIFGYRQLELKLIIKSCFNLRKAIQVSLNSSLATARWGKQITANICKERRARHINKNTSGF